MADEEAIAGPRTPRFLELLQSVYYWLWLKVSGVVQKEDHSPAGNMNGSQTVWLMEFCASLEFHSASEAAVAEQA